MEKEPLIIWQKWVDPFGADDLESDEFDPYVGKYNDDQLEEDDDEDNTFKHVAQQKIQAVKAIATPMGIIPITENTASGKIFNFWIGHTNFDLSKKVVQIIEKINGVETLDVFTRYRFRISVGKAFDDSEVMRDINKKIYREITDGQNKY